MEKYRAKRTCPICNHDKVEKLYEYNCDGKKFHNKLPSYFNIVACDRCGFVYYDILASQDIYDEYYENYSVYENMGKTYGMLSEDSKKIFEIRANEISRYVGRDDNIMDIGCANGFLLDELKKKGYGRLSGLDLSNSCMDIVRSKGYHAYLGGVFSEHDSLYSAFELVCLTQVLEHIYDLRKAMENIKRLVKPNGYIYIEVPDVARYKMFSKYAFSYLNYEHINHFDSISLENLGSEFGLKTVEIIQRDAKFNTDEPTMPYVVAVLQNVLKETNAKEAFLDYANSSSELLAGFVDFISNIDKEIVIWGIGTSAMKLLKKINSKTRIKYLVDSNPIKEDTVFNGLAIISPQKLKESNFKGVVLISTAFYENEVVEQMKDLGIECKYISMFDASYEIKQV